MEFALRNMGSARRNIGSARRNIQFARQNIQFARRNIQFARRGMGSARGVNRSGTAPQQSYHRGRARPRGYPKKTSCHA
jgi:hypothetical protein